VQGGVNFKKVCYGSADLSAEKKDTGPFVCFAFINGDFRIDIIYTLFAVFSSSHQQSLSSTLRGSVRGTNRFFPEPVFCLWFVVCGSQSAISEQ
jgi:hypothetical protein